MNTAPYDTEGDKDFDTQPPSYSEAESGFSRSRHRYPTLHWWEDNERYKRCQLLRWFLLEIIVVTFSIDPWEMKGIIRRRFSEYSDDWMSDDPNYFLCKTYRIMLAELCLLVRDLRHQFKTNRWAGVSNEDLRLFNHVVRGPIGKKRLWVPYVLETLVRYKHVGTMSGMALREKETLLDFYMRAHLTNPPPKWKWTDIFSMKKRTHTPSHLADVLLSHATVIDYICNEPGYEWSELQVFLEQAMDTFKNDKSLKRLYNSKEMGEWPLEVL